MAIYLSVTLNSVCSCKLWCNLLNYFYTIIFCSTTHTNTKETDTFYWQLYPNWPRLNQPRFSIHILTFSHKIKATWSIISIIHYRFLLYQKTVLNHQGMHSMRPLKVYCGVHHLSSDFLVVWLRCMCALLAYWNSTNLVLCQAYV